MQDWDRLVVILLGSGVAIYTSIAGWQSWKARQIGAAIGTFLLAAAAVALPWILVIMGG